MKQTKLILVVLTGFALFLGFALDSTEAKPIWAKAPKTTTNPGSNNPALIPLPATIDQIIHENGNIRTTVDNWGYIGGYQYAGAPSAEWPRNSGHDYIGELRYWMGAIVGNDTLVANSYDDFQGMTALISSQAQYKIMLSTDTTRYYDYDLADTIGLGNGNPAQGWKVWDHDSTDYVYATNYNPIDSQFFSGGPISVQESHYRFNDAFSGTSLLGLEMTHTVLQWNYCYNEDFMFVILEISNTSNVDYANFAFGLYVDLDVGGPDGSGENGRLGDLVAYDSAANLAWTYDEDHYDVGWDTTTGIMGTKYLETPGGNGMTGFRTGLWALVPNDDPGKFESINMLGFDSAIAPDDQYYIQCTNGIDLLADSTVRVVYALVAGADSTDFRANADLAQNLYDNYFVGPQPPNTPTLTAKSGDRKVYLLWDDTAEVSIDPLSGENDFGGYKLYRSEDRGLTWGAIDTSNTNTCLGTDFERLGEWVTNPSTGRITHNFVDSIDLYNDVEYWYTLVAIDTGASETGVEPLQTGFGTAGKAPNVIKLIPRSDPAGYISSESSAIHNYTGTNKPSTGVVSPFAVGSVVEGAEYEVVFEDRPERTFWHLINTISGDTLLKDQTMDVGEPGEYPVVDGITIVVTNPVREPVLMEQTTVAGASATLTVPYYYGTLTEYFDDTLVSDATYRSTYELRFTGNNTAASAINDNVGNGMAWLIPFEIWNTTSNERVGAVVYDFGLDGTWDSWDLITIVNAPYNAVVDPFDDYPHNFGWFFGFDDVSWNPTTGDIFTIEGPALNSPEDVFSFSAAGVIPALATEQLKDIKVVPNPYMAHNWRMVEAAGEVKLSFHNMPDEGTIRIYTLAGDLVTTIEEPDESGVWFWNLQSSDRRQVASGTYIYHVESPYGEHLGRFAVIK